MKKILLFVSAALLAVSSATAQVTIDFEEFEMEKDQANNGKELTPGAGFISQGFKFCNGYMDYGGYDYFDGFAISTQTSTAYTSLDDQFNSCVGSGADKSKTYAVFYYSPWGGNAMEITHSENRLFSPQSLAVTNNAYAFSSLTNSDSFAKRFTEEDWFQLYLIGKKGDVTTGTVTVDLAAGGMLLFAWKTIDLTSLGEVDRIELSMNSTDVGAYGMNTPSYCCFDNLKMVVGETTSAAALPASAPQATVEAILTPDGKRISTLNKGMNILLMSDGSTRKIFK